MIPSPECGGTIDVKLLAENGVKFLVSPYAPYKAMRFGRDIGNFLKKNEESPVSFCHIDELYFAKLMEAMKLPNTGINAILDLLKHDIAELYITGFTFFKGGYMKEYRKYNEQQVMEKMARCNLHDQDKQLVYMRRVLKVDKRVKMDSALAAIINEAKTHRPKLRSISDAPNVIPNTRKKIQRIYKKNVTISK